MIQEGDSRRAFGVFLTRIAIVQLFRLVAGIVWHGISAEVLDRLLRNIVARPGGPMTFRFVLQPARGGVTILCGKGGTPRFVLRRRDEGEPADQVLEQLHASSTSFLLDCGGIDGKISSLSLYSRPLAAS